MTSGPGCHGQRRRRGHRCRRLSGSSARGEGRAAAAAGLVRWPDGRERESGSQGDRLGNGPAAAGQTRERRAVSQAGRGRETGLRAKLKKKMIFHLPIPFPFSFLISKRNSNINQIEFKYYFKYTFDSKNMIRTLGWFSKINFTTF